MHFVDFGTKLMHLVVSNILIQAVFNDYKSAKTFFPSNALLNQANY
jgi:hypothetical protein